MEAFLRNQILNVCRVRHNQRFREVNLRALPKHPRFERLNVDGDIIRLVFFLLKPPQKTLLSLAIYPSFS